VYCPQVLSASCGVVCRWVELTSCRCVSVVCGVHRIAHDRPVSRGRAGEPCCFVQIMNAWGGAALLGGEKHCCHPRQPPRSFLRARARRASNHYVVAQTSARQQHALALGGEAAARRRRNQGDTGHGSEAPWPCRSQRGWPGFSVESHYTRGILLLLPEPAIAVGRGCGGAGFHRLRCGRVWRAALTHAHCIEYHPSKG
jgi:hypothetical protein